MQGPPGHGREGRQGATSRRDRKAQLHPTSSTLVLLHPPPLLLLSEKATGATARCCVCLFSDGTSHVCPVLRGCALSLSRTYASGLQPFSTGRPSPATPQRRRSRRPRSARYVSGMLNRSPLFNGGFTCEDANMSLAPSCLSAYQVCLLEPRIRTVATPTMLSSSVKARRTRPCRACHVREERACIG